MIEGVWMLQRLTNFTARLMGGARVIAFSTAFCCPLISQAQVVDGLPEAALTELPPAPLNLAALEGNWQLVAVLGASAGDAAAPPVVIDWSQASAHFQVLFEVPTELHATFAGPPLSAVGAVAGGSLMLDDPSRGTLKLTSQQPTPITKLLRELDAGLLPEAFVVGEQKGDAQYVYIRRELDAADDEARLVQQASARAALPVASSRLAP